MFEERQLKYLCPEDYDDLSNTFFPHIVLKLELQGTRVYLDFGTILYRNHTKVNKRTHSSSVYRNTLIVDLVEPMRNYFLDMVKKYSHASIKHFFKVIRVVVKDLYKLYENIEWKDKGQAIEIYKGYTHHLIMDRATKLKNSISDMGTYSRKQTVLAEIISRSLGIDIQEIKSSYVEVASKHKQPIQPVQQENFIKFFELNKRIFLTLIDFFISENKQFPIEIIFDECNINKAFYYFNENDNKQDNYIINEQRSHVKMINLACSSFINCLIAATSMNAAQIYSLRVDNIKDLQSSTKGTRVLTVKPRAGYKSVEFTMPMKFKILLNKFLEFRQWVHQNYNLDCSSSDCKELLFFGLNKCITVYGENSIVSYSEAQHILYRKWFKDKFPSVDWIPLSKLRATIANIYHNESNSSLSVAKKLSNSPRIVSGSYSEATENQVMSEMTDTFSEIAKAAPVISSRSTSIKINLLNTFDTDMGHCLSRNPKLDTAYKDTDLDDPNCSNAISCLFCENYVIHTDDEDIRKLLSAQKVFEMANSPFNTENIYNVLQRINEIFALIKEIHPEKMNHILSISREIKEGKLTLFFGNLMNLMTDLGIDFNE